MPSNARHFVSRRRRQEAHMCHMISAELMMTRRARHGDDISRQDKARQYRRSPALELPQHYQRAAIVTSQRGFPTKRFRQPIANDMRVSYLHLLASHDASTPECTTYSGRHAVRKAHAATADQAGLRFEKIAEQLQASAHLRRCHLFI